MNPDSGLQGRRTPVAGGIRAIAVGPRSRGVDRLAAVMVLAPALGLAIWAGIFTLI